MRPETIDQGGATSGWDTEPVEVRAEPVMAVRPLPAEIGERSNEFLNVLGLRFLIRRVRGDGFVLIIEGFDHWLDHGEYVAHPKCQGRICLQRCCEVLCD